MNNLDKENRMICKKCKKIFDISEAAVTYRTYGGAQRRDKVCPHCGGGFRAIEPSGCLDKYLYVNDDPRYYSYD